jgi:hypothetical protein
VRVLHAVGAARSTEGRRWVRARKSPDQVSNAYFQADNYELEAEPAPDAPPGQTTPR